MLGQIAAGVKLKKTQTNDRSGIVKAGLDAEHIEKYHQDVFDTYVEEWEPLLSEKRLTFRTKYLPIDKEAADWLVESYQEFDRFDDAQKHDSPDEGKRRFEEWFEDKMEHPAAKSLCGALQGKIDECMEDFGCSKVFVKGSSRSAKDSVVFTKHLKTDLTTRVESLREAGTLDSNTSVIAMLGAGKDSMASNSALYFLRLFIRSERIYQDLTLAKEQKGDGFVQGFAIREWVDIDIGMEFRAFVHEGKLNAVCQYDYLVLIKELLDPVQCEELCAQLRRFWATDVHPALAPKSTPNGHKFASYVVDFAVDTTGRQWVIELNPFQESTDGAMFSWVQEGETLRNGPFKFRVQKMKQNADVCLSRVWRGLLKTVVRGT